MLPGFADQAVQKRRCVAELACCVGVIGFKAERLEEGLILKERQEFVFAF